MYANTIVYNGADPIGDNDSIEVVIEYILPISLGGTMFANIERHIGFATPFSSAIMVPVRKKSSPFYSFICAYANSGNKKINSLQLSLHFLPSNSDNEEKIKFLTENTYQNIFAMDMQRIQQ